LWNILLIKIHFCCRNPTTNNLCSKCYKDSTAALEKEKAPQETALLGAVSASEDSDAYSDSSAFSPVGSPPDVASGSMKKASNRCGVCRKKVGLTGFKCRCEGLFCSIHRYSDKHDCSIDYQALAKDKLKKENPVVEASKLERI